jgi:hypothetical protein
MKIFGHWDGDVNVERIAFGRAAVQDEISGDGAVGDADGGVGGAAEYDGSGDVADGGAGDVGAIGSEMVTVNVDLAARHGSDGG